MTPIDLAAERDKRNGPESDHVRRDGFGRPLFRYALSYQMGDSSWCTHVWAYSMEDAADRVAAMRSSLTLDGQVYSTVPL